MPSVAAAAPIFVDGDFVVFVRQPTGDRATAPTTPRARRAADGPVAHDGFTTYGDASVLPRYEIRLVDVRG